MVIERGCSDIISIPKHRGLIKAVGLTKDSPIYELTSHDTHML